MTWLWTTLLWLGWAVILLVGGLFSLLIVAFAGDAPQNKRAAQWLVSITVAACAAAAVLSRWVQAGRDSWIDIVAGYLIAVAPVPVLILAIKLTFPR